MHRMFFLHLFAASTCRTQAYAESFHALVPDFTHVVLFHVVRRTGVQWHPKKPTSEFVILVLFAELNALIHVLFLFMPRRRAVAPREAHQ